MALELAPNSAPDVDSDGEDRDERREFDIEQGLRDFVNEPPVNHGVYPDTDSDEDDEVHRMVTRHEINRGDGVLFIGQEFINGVAYKEAVLDYVMRTGRNLRQYKYDRVKAGFKCLGGDGSCRWRIYASIVSKTGKWQVKKGFDKTHTCVPNGECEMFRLPVIARLFLDKIRAEPEYFMPLNLCELIREKWRITVSRDQCQQARYKALRWIQKEYSEQFSRIRNYKNEILESNPNSSVEVDCLTNEEGLDVFHRFYVCFDNLRRSWKETCRPLIGLDGCFLRSNMKGHVLVALGQDGNNAIHPIAWAVVPAENFIHWEWFVKKIKTDLELGSGEGFIMVSDRQKGLIKAVQQELPGIEHRMCVRHIYGNLKAKYGKKPDMKYLIWQLAWSYNEPQYYVNLDRIFNYDSAVHANVLKSKPKTWCRAFQKTGNQCEDVENNSTESWNRTISKAREKPLVPMLEIIARLAMVRIAKRDVEACVWTGLCTPYVVKYLVALHKEASLCTIYRSTNNTYDAYLHGCSYHVNLADRTCTCKRFEITGIPCEHAYGVILDRNLVAEEYVCHWFRTAKWRRTYTDGVIPYRGSDFWPDKGEAKVYPDPKAMQDKKDKKRKKGVNESPTKKQPKQLKRIMHCSYCQATTHNVRFHKDKQASRGESSQGPQAQGPQASQSTQAPQIPASQLSQASQLTQA